MAHYRTRGHDEVPAIFLNQQISSALSLTLSESAYIRFVGDESNLTTTKTLQEKLLVIL